MNKCFIGDCIETMRELAADGVKVQTCVTSPPYWALRDYGHADQYGLEPVHDCLGWATGDPCGECHVCRMVEVFRHVREMLADDGTLWLNYGDSYAGSPGGEQGKNGQRASRTFTARIKQEKKGSGLKPKDLVGIPWRVALALQADGWYLRQDIIWNKPNPMPEPAKDRCTKAHEYIFLLSKSRRYYYDQEAILEPVSPNTHKRLSQAVEAQIGSERGNGGAKHNGNMKAVGRQPRPSGWDGQTGEGRHDKKVGRYPGERKLADPGSGTKNNTSMDEALAVMPEKRNKRSVWTVASQPFSGAHFATFPPALIEPCILAGSRAGDIVLDPFFGSGTTGQVAQSLGRQWIGCEINPDYVELQKQRTAQMGLEL